MEDLPKLTTTTTMTMEEEEGKEVLHTSWVDTRPDKEVGITKERTIIMILKSAQGSLN